MQYGSYNLLATYSNPRDVKTYEKVAKALVKARKDQPFKLQTAPKGVPSRKLRHSDVVFVMLASD
jgi:hypothetical protein